MFKAILASLFWFMFGMGFILMGLGCAIFYLLLEDRDFLYIAIASGICVLGSVYKIFTVKYTLDAELDDEEE